MLDALCHSSRLLIVASHPVVVGRLAGFAYARELHARFASTSAEALEVLESGRVTLLVVEDQQSGVELDALLRATGGPEPTTEPECTRLVLVHEPARAEASIRAGADHVVPIPPEVSLLAAVLAAAERQEERRWLRRAQRAALELTSDSVEITDPQARILFANESFERLTGYRSEEAVGRTPAQLLRSHVMDQGFYDAMWQTVTAGRTWRGTLVGRRKDETLVHEVATVQPVTDGRGTIRHLVAIKQSIPWSDEESQHGSPAATTSEDQLREAVARLRFSERRYRAMMNAAGDAILTVDFETAHVVDANRATSELFGYGMHELRGMTPRMLCMDDAASQVDHMSEQLRRTGKAFEPCLPMVRKDGTRFYAMVRCSLFEVAGQRLEVGIIRDVSDQVERQMELARSNEELRRAQEGLVAQARLAALGQLAATVGHEINNPLQFVETNLEVLAEQLSPHPEHTASWLLQETAEGVRRIGVLSRALVPFARIDDAQVTWVGVDDVVSWACKMANNEIRHRARLTRSFGVRSNIPGHAEQLTQLVTNLLVNAAHAIEEGHAAHNRIEVETREHDGVVTIQVTDTGCGIPADIQGQVFDPFFTTKRPGDGTGLGLALCNQIAQAHDGRIAFESQPGRGTRFTVTLPMDNGLVPVGEPPPAPSRQVARGRILVIDDDELVLKAYRRALRHEHDVVVARGGEEALRILESDRAFDVILCDLMMPTLDGVELHRRLAADVAELADRIVFCSGGAFTARARELVQRTSTPFLTKPVSPDRLRKVVAAMIADPNEGPGDPPCE